MTSEVLHNHLEATYITVDTVSFYGVKQKPSLVLVNSQGAPFTYRDNQVSQAINGQMKQWMEEIINTKISHIPFFFSVYAAIPCSFRPLCLYLCWIAER